jgi:hypothetical protein
VETDPADVYLAVFLARCDDLRRADQTKIEEPG